MSVLSFLWSLLRIFLSACVGYQLILFIGNALIQNTPCFGPSKIRRFNVLVPAHKELYLPRLLESLR